MAGVFCDRCKTNVMLEQDGMSCSNCGAVLVRPARAAKKPKDEDELDLHYGRLTGKTAKE